eukprot:TRINITY_DN10594_c0_g1_i1.p1 TRINITY_DN10594_c0_g1~~TRINITY_DN10594_c0_g1_i1.p1  ORF type:complete len:361 (+),score=47.39 TRINITY_DN10594_c0_g1_i1:143-1225(+)
MSNAAVPCGGTIANVLLIVLAWTAAAVKHRTVFQKKHHTRFDNAPSEHQLFTDTRGYSNHFLTNTELRSTASIACLKAKQNDPRVVCEGPTSVPPTTLTDAGALGDAQADADHWHGGFNAGHFPNYMDAACKSGGEYFCDPHGVLSDEDRTSLGEHLKQTREQNFVTCGHLVDNKVNQPHLEPFYLGVVIFRDWPLSQSDPESLQQLGQFVLAQWNMNEAYVGSVRSYTRCPNVGILFILANNRLTYLSTESCEFVCQSRGGPEVMTASQMALRSSPRKAAAAGIDGVYRFLSGVPAVSSVPVVSGIIDAATKREKRATDFMTVFLRIVFACSTIMVVLSLLVAAGIACLAPGGMKGNGR